MAQIDTAVITGSAAVDFVSFALWAAGGIGGTGGEGGNGAASSFTQTEFETEEVIGTADGQTGANSTQGIGRVVIRNVTLDLGDGADTLAFSLGATGSATSISVSGNSFAGGLGTDRLLLGQGATGEGSAFVNVQTGMLRYARRPGSTFSGFKLFDGGSGNDSFIDGAGNQTYESGGGADTFVFVAGRAGADQIDNLTAEDIIRLARFGVNLDSFAEVLAVTTDTAEGALIQTSARSSILLAGVNNDSLVADDFLF